MILTKIISTAKVELLIIGGLPEDAFNVEISKSHYRGKFKLTFLTKTCIYEDHTIILKEGNWQPVGFLKDVSEFEAKRLMGNETTCNNFYIGTFTGIDTTAKESLLSLIESEVKLKNKFSYAPTGSYVEDWDIEQSDVFTNPFILIKK